MYIWLYVILHFNNSVYFRQCGLVTQEWKWKASFHFVGAAAAAAAKSLQSCLTLRPHRQQPTRLRRPWDSPGKNTGVGCHFLLQYVKVKSEREVAQSCPTLRPHRRKPTRLFHSWEFPGKSTGVEGHRLFRWYSLATHKHETWGFYLKLNTSEPTMKKAVLNFVFDMFFRT